jgi:hypothetical protein
MVLTHQDDLLIAAAGDSVVFFDTGRMESGGSSPAFQWVSDGPSAGSIYVNVTADDKTLFVSDEGMQTITVMDLERIRSLGRDSAANLKRLNTADGASSAVIGRIPLASRQSRSRFRRTSAGSLPPATHRHRPRPRSRPDTVRRISQRISFDRGRADLIFDKF